MKQQQVNYLALSRASTKEQATKGASHQTQLRFIVHNPICAKWNCIAQLEDTISGKSKERQLFKDIYKYCLKKPGVLSYILVQKWDRWSRDLETAFHWINKFANIGVEVNAVEQWIAFGTGIESTLLGLYIGQAQDEVIKNSMRIKDNLYTLQMQGYYVKSKPPTGYYAERSKVNGRSFIYPDGKISTIVQEVFYSHRELMLSKHSLWSKYSDKLRVKRSPFYRMFDNIVFAGMIEVRDIKGNICKTVVGKHEGLITVVEYEKMQRVSNALAKHNKKKVIHLNPSKNRYYLKGHLLCSKTNLKMTASASKGRHGKKYHYYHITGPGGQRIKMDDAHSLIEKALQTFKLSSPAIAYIEKKLKSENRGLVRQLKKERTEIVEILAKLQKGANKWMLELNLGNITLDEYREMKESSKLLELEWKSKLEVVNINLQKADKTVYEHLTQITKIHKVFKKSSSEMKSKMLKCIFPDGFFMNIQNGVLEPLNINFSIAQLLSFQSDTEVIKIKGTPKNTESLLAEKEGIISNQNNVFQMHKTLFFELVTILKCA